MDQSQCYLAVLPNSRVDILRNCSFGQLLVIFLLPVRLLLPPPELVRRLEDLDSFVADLERDLEQLLLVLLTRRRQKTPDCGTNKFRPPESFARP